MNDPYENIGPTNEQIGEISRLAARQRELEERVTQAQSDLKALQEQLRGVAERDLPSAMDAAGCAEYKLLDGTKVSVKEDLYASVPKKNLPAVVQWLAEHELGSLVREDLVVRFEKGEIGEAQALVEYLKAQPVFAHRWSQQEQVNTSSLKGAIRELMAEGQEVPLELFGAYIRRVAKLS